MFGDEDADEIRPAVEQARELGIDARGPFPADSLFCNGLCGSYDGYIGMYHDQAHMPVKTLAFRKTSALVIGVPINWATVGHGCALDIAWKRKADAGVPAETIKLVSRRALARGRLSLPVKRQAEHGSCAVRRTPPVAAYASTDRSSRRRPDHSE